ncbi:uncharacterized protein LOC115700245 isoform X1 [Cannabis sativa]|uniref:Uncharacterized protein n=2 Tax=Cannabis sativa TaxID=3483 RepID=A0ABZ3NPG8_CANSA|nr:uncharacterized protein LOC115700245 isoform X1 [Cannabis sativa]KAF4394478.1 hypothetical protein G4B88_018628 [Cannabis sativa]
MESSKRESSSRSTRAGPSNYNEKYYSKAKPPLPNLSLSLFSVEEAIALLKDDLTRPNALVLLGKMKSNHQNMGPMVWNSSGTIFILLKEITQIYRWLSSGLIAENMAKQVCNALLVLQSVASHPQSRKEFIKANLAEYLYPLISITHRQEPYENLRVASLGVLGSLLKQDDAEALHYLIQGDIFSKCLICLQTDSLTVKTVAAFILERFLSIGEEGLEHCCSSAENFLSLSRTLAQNIQDLGREPCKRFLNHIINCYLKLAENPRACDILEWQLPAKLTNVTFLQNDPTLITSVRKLVLKVSTGNRTQKMLRPNGKQVFTFRK